MLTKWWLSLIEVSVTTGVVLLILLPLSSRFSRKYPAKWFCWVWLLLAVRLLIPVNLSLPQAPVRIPLPETPIVLPQNEPAAGEQTSGTASPSVQSLGQTAPSSPSAVSARARITPISVLMLVWLAGFLLFGFHQLTAYRLFRKRVLRWSRPAEDRRLAAQLDRLRAEMHIRSEILLRISETGGDPMMTGFVKPLLLLPTGDYGDTELAFILKHELTHWKRRDLWYKLLLLLANAVHWFNPLVYWMVREADSDLELSCDDEVLRGAARENRRQYGEAILNAAGRPASGKAALSTNFNGGTKAMKKRIRNLFSTAKRRRGILALCAVLGLTCLASGFVACRQKPEGSVKPAQDIASSDDGSSYADGAEPAASLPTASETANTVSAAYSSGPAGSGNSYRFAGAKLLLSYRNGETTAETELPIDTSQSHQSANMQTGVWMSDQITAVVYGGPDRTMEVMISGDKGKMWNTYPISMGPDFYGYNKIRIGFTSKQDGWLLIDGGVGCGTQESYFLRTSDGGRTWTQVGDTLYTRLLDGAGFATKEIGFLCSDITGGVSPMLYRTQDGGKSWEDPIQLPIAEKYLASDYEYYLSSPVFDGANGVVPVTIENENQTIQGQYVTSDYGNTWAYTDA